MSNANAEVKRWSGPDANNRITEWVTTYANHYDQLAHQRDELRRERDEAVAALKDIKEWCENAKRSVGVEPYGLAVVNAVLTKLWSTS